MKRILPLAMAALFLASCHDATDPVPDTGLMPVAANPGAAEASGTGVPVVVLGPGEAHDVNDRGQVVGWSYNAAGDKVAVLWSDGEVIDLGAPPDYVAVGINNRGEIAIGVLHPYAGPSNAYRWYRGELTMIVADATVRGINERGQVIGFLRRDAPTDLGFIWSDGVLTLLDPLPPQTASRAQAINPKGEAVGFSAWGDGGVDAQFWEVGGDTYLLPAPEGYEGRAMGVNSRGLAVGRVEQPGRIDRRAVLWRGGQLVELDDADGPSSGANGLNARGMIAGWYTPPGGEQRPALWAGNDYHLVDLGLPAGAEYSGPAVAIAINERGLVAGSGGADTRWAFVWRP